MKLLRNSNYYQFLQELDLGYLYFRVSDLNDMKPLRSIINLNSNRFPKFFFLDYVLTFILNQIHRNNSNSANKHKKTMLHYNFVNNQLINSDAGETTSTDSDIGTSPSGTTLASPPSSPQQLIQQQQQQQQQNQSSYPTINENLNVYNSNSTHNKYTNSTNKYDMPFNNPDLIINSSPISSQSSTATLNNNNNNNNNNSNSRSSKNPNNNILNSSIVRQHSYLNAVQLNDYKQSQMNQQNKQNNFSQTQAFKQLQSKLKALFFNLILEKFKVIVNS